MGARVFGAIAALGLGVVLLAALSPGTAGGQEPGQECALIRPQINGEVIAYRARIERGGVPCQEAEAVLVAFLDDRTPDPGSWDCYLTTADTPWIATCRNASALLRADWIDPTVLPAPRSCGVISARGDLVYRLRVRSTEDVSCQRARSLIRGFVVGARSGVPAGWECAYGGARYPYSFACGRRVDGVLVLYVRAQTISSRPTYRGWVGGFEDDRRRNRVQGNYHALNFMVSPGRRVHYRVCLSGGVGARRCFERTTSVAGRSSINVSIFVNDQGGPGDWTAVWTVRGRRVASWRFTLRPEGV
jgi:hypothetical protein